MIKWKKLLAGLLAAGMLFSSGMAAYAEEEYEEDPIPDSYYYTIETNDLEGWPQGPAIEAASAAVMDLDSGAFLYSKNATAKQYPASITKIMTTLLLLENCDLDAPITFSDVVYKIEDGSSHLGVQPGEEMTIRDCAYGIMLASANDMSNGIAEYVAGSVEAFADMMNERAAKIGCVNTHFSNPHGLYSDDHYTCAHDMALIAREAYKNPAFREITGTHYYTRPKTNLNEEEWVYSNHHKMLDSDSEYYRSWVTGGKNGFTEACLNTLVTFGELDGKRLVGVILRVNGAGKAYEETTQIMEYGFNNFVTENKSIGNTNESFYGIIDMIYPGEAGKWQSPAWKRQASSGTYITVSYPYGFSKSSLQKDTSRAEGSLERRIGYSWQSWPLGTARGTFYPFAGPVEFFFERPSPFAKTELTSVQEGNLQLESFSDVRVFAKVLTESGYDFLISRVKEHPGIAIAAAAAVVLIVGLFLTLLILRATKKMRRRRRRRIAALKQQQREEEIDRMTTAEIEAELRAALQEEAREKLER